MTRALRRFVPTALMAIAAATAAGAASAASLAHAPAETGRCAAGSTIKLSSDDAAYAAVPGGRLTTAYRVPGRRPTTTDANGNCVGPVVCPSGTTRDAQGNCIAPVVCPTGTTEDADGNCVAPVVCPSGTTMNDEGKCVAPVVCPSGTTIDTQGTCVATSSPASPSPPSGPSTPSPPPSPASPPADPAPATPSSPAAPPPPTSGVAGEEKTITPKEAAQRVRRVGRVAALPFTGLPLGSTALVGLLLLSSGLALRRVTRPARGTAPR